jgi:uncharacterized repeat protein (TIGR01451 family)
MRQPRSLVILILLFMILIAATPVARAADSSGTDYWVTFPRSMPPDGHLYLSISSPTATSGLVSNASLGINIPFAVAAGTPTLVEIPFVAQLDVIDAVENKGLHVTSLAPVVIYGTNQRNFSSDGYLALPTDAIGTDYVVMAWASGSGVGSELAIVGTQNGTNVTITPKAVAGPHTAGVPFVIALGQGQTYFLAAGDDHDLTGTTVVADKPISLFGGHSCGLAPTGFYDFCDHMVEQMFPTSAWGTNFLTVPLATRTGGDVVRMISSQDDTSISVNGVVVKADLDLGSAFEISLSSAARISATKPICVAQVAKGSKFDDNPNADPFEMLIVPTSRMQSSYLVATSANALPINYLNVVVPTPAVAGVKLDGGTVPPASFTPIGGSGYSGAQLPVAVGSHTVTAGAPLGVSVYGFGPAEGYGYPGGTLLSSQSANLSIQKTPGLAAVPILGQVTYTIVASNAGPDAVAGARVSDLFPPSLTNVSWTCLGAGDASCAAGGAGNIDDTVVLPVGGSVTYSVTAKAPAAPGLVSNTATIQAPDNTDDPAQANNSSSADVQITYTPAVPALSEWALALIGIALSIGGVLALRRQ